MDTSSARYGSWLSSCSLVDDYRDCSNHNSRRLNLATALEVKIAESEIVVSTRVEVEIISNGARLINSPIIKLPKPIRSVTVRVD